jgi:hypothetical protein
MGLSFLPGVARCGSKDPSMTQNLRVAATAAPRTHGDLQSQRESVEVDLLNMLGLQLLLVEIRVYGATFYRGFHPNS